MNNIIHLYNKLSIIAQVHFKNHVHRSIINVAVHKLYEVFRYMHELFRLKNMYRCSLIKAKRFNTMFRFYL